MTVLVLLLEILINEKIILIYRFLVDLNQMDNKRAKAYKTSKNKNSANISSAIALFSNNISKNTML
jgi:hypothetical protein